MTPHPTLRLIAFGAVSVLTRGSSGSLVPENEISTYPAEA
jgi:hypothetical protein